MSLSSYRGGNYEKHKYLSFSPIKPWTHTQCLFHPQIKAWDTPSHNWSIQTGFWKLLFVVCEDVTVRNNLFTGQFEEMHVLIPPTYLFPLEHKQISGWRWTGLSSLLLCLMRKVLIHSNSRCSTEGAANGGELHWGVIFFYLFKAATLQP